MSKLSASTHTEAVGLYSIFIQKIIQPDALVKRRVQRCIRRSSYFRGYVLGISRDLPSSHRKFANKHWLKVKSLIDPDHKVMDAYGVWSIKKMYNREGYGVLRSTFLISPDGHIAHIWQSVKVKGHVETVIKTLKDSRNRPINI